LFLSRGKPTPPPTTPPLFTQSLLSPLRSVLVSRPVTRPVSLPPLFRSGRACCSLPFEDRIFNNMFFWPPSLPLRRRDACSLVYFADSFVFFHRGLLSSFPSTPYHVLVVIFICCPPKFWFRLTRFVPRCTAKKASWSLLGFFPPSASPPRGLFPFLVNDPAGIFGIPYCSFHRSNNSHGRGQFHFQFPFRGQTTFFSPKIRHFYPVRFFAFVLGF